MPCLSPYAVRQEVMPVIRESMYPYGNTGPVRHPTTFKCRYKTMISRGPRVTATVPSPGIERYLPAVAPGAYRARGKTLGVGVV